LAKPNSRRTHAFPLWSKDDGLVGAARFAWMNRFEPDVPENTFPCAHWAMVPIQEMLDEEETKGLHKTVVKAHPIQVLEGQHCLEQSSLLLEHCSRRCCRATKNQQVSQD